MQPQIMTRELAALQLRNDELLDRVQQQEQKQKLLLQLQQHEREQHQRQQQQQQQQQQHHQQQPPASQKGTQIVPHDASTQQQRGRPRWWSPFGIFG